MIIGIGNDLIDIRRVAKVIERHGERFLDRIFTEASDRLRGQLVRADRILTGTLEAVEDAGSKFRHGLWKPMQRASALIQGIKVGLDLLRSGRGNRHPEDAVEREEELFI